MNLSTFDLNLLVTFDALMTERNVTRAGERLGRSQPAMSAALNRLRYLLKDDLFVRCGNMMRPTPRALEIADSVSGILNQIYTTLTPQTFDPTMSRRKFKIAMNDMGAALFLPPLIRHLGESASNIEFEAIHAYEEEAVRLLEEGLVDAATVIYGNQSRHLQSMTLYEAPFVCALRRDHPMAGRYLSLEEFASIPRVAIAQRNDPGQRVQQLLESQGLRQQISVTVPHYLAAPYIVAQTDYVGIIPLKMVERLKASENICTAKVAFGDLSTHIRLVWNTSMTSDSANKWLRSVIISVVHEYELDKWIALGTRPRAYLHA